MKRSEMLIFVLQTVKKIAIDALVEQNFDNDFDLFLIDDFDFDLKIFIFLFFGVVRKSFSNVFG